MLLNATRFFNAQIALAAPEASTDAASAYRIVETMRGEGLEQTYQKALNDADFAAAMAKMNDVLQYLETPLIRDLANGDKFLHGIRFTILFENARIYATRGGPSNIEKALSSLERAHQDIMAAVLQKMLTTVPHFAVLKDEARFKALLQKLEAMVRFWRVPAIATAYKEKLSVEERVAGCSDG